MSLKIRFQSNKIEILYCALHKRSKLRLYIKYLSIFYFLFFLVNSPKHSWETSYITKQNYAVHKKKKQIILLYAILYPN